MRRKRIAFGIGANLLDQGVIILIQLLTVALLVRFWGPAGFGVWAMMTAIPTMLALGDLGFGAAAAVRMTMELARGETTEAARTLAAAVRVVCVAALVVVFGALLFVWAGRGLLGQWLPELGAIELFVMPFALAAYAAGVLFSGLSQAMFRSSGRFAQGMMLSTATNAAEAALLFTAAALGWGIGWAALAWASGRLAGVMIQWIVASRALPGLVQSLRQPVGDRVQALISPSLSAIALPIARSLLLQGTVVVLGVMVGAAAVPAFVAARTLSRIGLQAAQLVTLPLMPEFGRASAQGERRSLERMLVLVAVTAAGLTIPFSAALAVLGPWLIDIWSGGKIAASSELLAVMAMSALFGGLWNPLSNLILAINRQGAFAWAYASLAVAGILMTMLAAAGFGSLAPALVLAAVDLAMLIIVGVFVWRNWAVDGNLVRTSRDLIREGFAGLRVLIAKRG